MFPTQEIPDPASSPHIHTIQMKGKYVSVLPMHA